MSTLQEGFWRGRTLDELNPQEWEALCDGCGRCCLHKIIDEDDQLYATRVACHLLDVQQCRCTRYDERLTVVPECLNMTPKLAAELAWLPSTCAYRRVALGEELPWWHPLLTGSASAMHGAGASVRDQAVSELEIDEDDLEFYIVGLLEPEAPVDGGED